MKKTILSILLVSSVFAQSYGTPEGHVTDRAKMLDTSSKMELEGALRAYEKRTTNEIAVLIVPTLGDTPLEEYATGVFHEWGIGKKGKDNGVLFLWATKERKIRIEVGYGLEGRLPDGRAGQIIREDITPSFKGQRWRDGVFGGVNAIIAQLDRVPPPPPPTPVSTPSTHVFLWFIFGGLVVFGILIAMLRTKKEPPPSIRLPVEPRRTYVPIPIPIPVGSRRFTRSKPSSYEPSPQPSSSDYGSSPSSSFGSSSGSDFGGFGGGDSGGGGASGSY